MEAGDALWKLFPFRSGNRSWAIVLMQGYALCLGIIVFLAGLLNFFEGPSWKKADLGGKQVTKGASAFDECLWFVFTTLHGVGFGEFMPRHSTGHVIACITIAVCYWWMILMMSIVMLSQLPGVKTPNLGQVLGQLITLSWPSYALFALGTILVGATMGPYVSNAPAGHNDAATGMYWFWCVMHRAPYGDIYPNTPEGRTVTALGAIVSYLYPPYAMALIALRRPSATEHEQLLNHLQDHPEDALGRGYIVPPTGREIQLNRS